MNDELLKNHNIRGLLADYLGMTIALISLIIIFGLSANNFFTQATFRTLANQVADVTIAAVGMTFVLIIAGIDLSVGSVMALAGAVRVLILADIPHLSAANYNEAKRFVILIDALYEAKVRLICSAADQPERLYIEGEGSFEFERTASRLREMQGAGWGL